MRFLPFLVMLFAFGACKRQPIYTLPTHEAHGTAKSKTDLPPVGKDFRSLKAESKARFKDTLNNVGFTLKIRLVKDSAIWIHTSKLGFDGVRAIITKDSLRILDKQKDTYYTARLDTLEKILNFRLDFQMLQAVLLADMPIATFDSSKVQLERSLMRIPQEKDGIMFTNFLHKPTQKLHELFLLDTRSKNTLQIYYSDFKEIDGNVFAQKNTIIVSFWNKKTGRLEKSEIEIDYNSVKFLRNSIDMPFTVPKNYKRN